MSLPAITDAELRATPVPMTFPAYSMSPFGGVRSAADYVFRDNIHLYPGAATGYDPDRYGYEKDAGSVGSVAHVADQSAIRLTLDDGTTGAKSRLRTHDHIIYQSGSATCVELTGYQSDTGVANQRRDFGLFDDLDGVMFRTNGAGVNQLVVRSSTTGSAEEDVVDQADWNETSYDTLDVTKGNRFRFVIAWLGVEGVQCFINGTLVHTFRYAGTLAKPYMKTANLPISVEIVNDDTAEAGGSLTYICSSARILNGGNYPLQSFTYSLSASSVADTMIPLFSIRVKALLNGITSRAQIIPKLVSFFSETQPGAMALVLGSTLTDATFAATSPSAGAEVDTAATAMTGGTELFRVGQGANAGLNYNLEDLFSLFSRKIRKAAFTGTSEVLTVGVVREGAVSFNPRVTLIWGELR